MRFSRGQTRLAIKPHANAVVSCLLPPPRPSPPQSPAIPHKPQILVPSSSHTCSLFRHQADINSQNLARLNRYCHRVSPVQPPTGNNTGANAASVEEEQPGAGGRIFPSLPGNMPPLPKPAPGGGGGGVDDLLGLGDLGITGGAPGEVGGSGQGSGSSSLGGNGGTDAFAAGTTLVGDGAGATRPPVWQQRVREKEFPGWVLVLCPCGGVMRLGTGDFAGGRSSAL